MAAAAHTFLENTEFAGLTDGGLAEQSLIAQHGGIWLRGRPDWLSADRRTIIDYKTISHALSPDQFMRRHVFAFGYDIQAAVYLLLNPITNGPERARFIWLVQHTEPPFACFLMGVSADLLRIGRYKFEHCALMWRDCLERGEWPGYSPEITYPEIPGWEWPAVELQGLSS